jgi:hypothetical protein
MNIITRLIWNNVRDKHDDKRKIIDWNKQKKTLAELSTNLTIKQVINPKNVKCIKMKEQKINLFAGTSNSIAISNTNTVLNTLGNGYNNSTSNGFVSVKYTANGLPMVSYP